MKPGDIAHMGWSLVAACSLVAGGLSARAETAEELVASGVLSGTDNPALIDFLLREGKDKPTPELHGKALDQAVATLRARAHVTPEEQLAAALSSAIGMAMQIADDDIVSEAGADVESSTYSGEWGNWVDAAEMLLEAGYTEDAVAFFQYGMETLPYQGLRNRCVMGLVKANPTEAYDRLMKMAAQPNIDLQNAALRSLGLLAGSGGLSDDQKDAAMALLIEKSQGLMNASYTLAAIRGLDYARDERAIEPLSKYKGGMMSTHDAWDRMFAGRLLMQAGKQQGFDWALKELTPKKKSFLSSKKDEPDLRYQVINTLTAVGGDAAREVLNKAYGHDKKSELMQASIAIALLVLDDDSDPNVRSSAAYALVGMSDAAAVSGLQAAMGVDYGVTAEKKSRSPAIHGAVLRAAMAKHSGEDGTAALVQAATASKDPTIRFMALVGR